MNRAERNVPIIALTELTETHKTVCLFVGLCIMCNQDYGEGGEDSGGTD